MKKLQLFMIAVLMIFQSCIDKEQCVKDYLEVDDWYLERTKMAGDNQEAKDLIYKEYLKKYQEIDAKCNK